MNVSHHQIKSVDPLNQEFIFIVADFRTEESITRGGEP